MAVFSPMPGTPGMLSEVSPIRAFRSIMWMGAKPYCSWKVSGVISLVVVCPMRVDTSFTLVWSVMSWRLSLSPVTTTQSQPAASHLAGDGADQVVGLPALQLIAGNVQGVQHLFQHRHLHPASSSGMGLRVAL